MAKERDPSLSEPPVGFTELVADFFDSKDKKCDNISQDGYDNIIIN